MITRVKMIRDDDDNNRDNKNNNKARLSIALTVIVFLASAPITMAFAQSTTTSPTAGETRIIETQDVSTANISEEDKQVNGITFTPRWGAVSTLATNEVTVLFADCLEGEMAISGMYIFEDTEDVVISQSFPVGTQENVMWVMVVKNTGNERQAVGIGVICAGSNGGGFGTERTGDVDFDIQTKITIDNTVKKFIRVEGDTITNINNIISIRQSIVQNAIQIVKITGNNNTVNQVINQAATQIASVTGNGTATPSPAVIQQAIDQSAQQAGVIQGGGSVSQLIEQDAQQEANITGGFGGTIEQDIEQDAGQQAEITRDGNTTTAPATIDQLIDQNAEQEAEIEQQEAAIEQLIEQQAGQEAEVEQGDDEAGGPDDAEETGPSAEITQDTEQDAQQNAEATEAPEEEQPPAEADGGADNPPAAT